MRVIGDVRIDDMPPPSRGNRYSTPVRNMIRNFLDSGAEACEISTDGYVDEKSAYISLIGSIKLAGLENDAWAYLRSGKLFLVRRDKYAEKHS